MDLLLQSSKFKDTLSNCKDTDTACVLGCPSCFPGLEEEHKSPRNTVGTQSRVETTCVFGLSPTGE